MGQRIKAFTDHKNLVHESELKTSQQVMCWRLLLEEYGPEIMYIKGPKNVVADALSRLPKQRDIVDDLEAVLPDGILTRQGMNPGALTYCVRSSSDFSRI